MQAGTNQAAHKRGKQKGHASKDEHKAEVVDSAAMKRIRSQNAKPGVSNQKKVKFNKLQGAARKAVGKSGDALSLVASKALETRKSQVPSQAEEDFLEIVRTGGVAAIVETMRSEIDYAWVAELGCRTLINILRFHHEVYGEEKVDSDGEPIETPSEVMFANGGFQLFVQLLLVFKDNDIVVEAVCALLSSLARFEDVNAERIAVLGGIQGLLNVARIHAEVLEVQIECMGALQSLALNNTNKILIAELGGIKAIFACMKRYSYSVELIREACGTICNLAVSEENEHIIMKLGGIQLLILTMKDHMKDPEVQWHACGAIHNLAMNDSSVELIADNGGIVAVSLCLRVHIDNDEVLIEALEALKHLARTDENKIKMIECSLPEMLDDIVMQYTTLNFREVRLCAQKLLKILRDKKVIGRSGLLARKQKGAAAFACLDLSEYALECLLYFTFLSLFLVHTVYLRDASQIYHFSDRLREYLIGSEFAVASVPNYAKTFDDIVTLEDVWYFLEGPLSGGLFADQWYNGEKYRLEPTNTSYAQQQISPHGNVLQYSRLLGGMRFRQLRVKNGTCDVLRKFQGPAYDMGGQELIRENGDKELVREKYPQSANINNSHFYINYCYGEWSSDNQDIEPFQGAHSMGLGPTRRDEDGVEETKKWNYDWSGENVTRTFTTPGKLANYPGSGYVVDVRMNSSHNYFRANGESQLQYDSTEYLFSDCDVWCTLAKLKKDRWLDLGTRALFVDFTLYSPYLNYHLPVSIVFEFPPTGAVIANAHFRPTQFHWYSGDNGMLQLVLEVVLIGFVFYYFRQEFIEIRENWRVYITKLWNMIDMLNCFVWLGVIAIHLYVFYVINVEYDMAAAVEEGQYVNLAYVSYLMSAERCLHSFAAILMWTKSFKYLEWSFHMSFLMRMIQWAAIEIMYFVIVFVIMFLGFAQAGYILFSSSIFEYSSFERCIITMLSSLGGMNVRAHNYGSHLNTDAMTAVSSVMGPLYFMMYQIGIFIVSVNIFVAILNDAYEANKNLLRSGQASTSDKSRNKKKQEENHIVAAARFVRSRVAKKGQKLMFSKYNKWIKEGIAVADIDGDNKITRGELLLEISTGMKRAGVKLSHQDALQLEHEVNDLFKNFDADNNGSLDANEVKNLKKKLAGNRKKKALLKKKFHAKAKADAEAEKEKKKQDAARAQDNEKNIRQLVKTWNEKHPSAEEQIAHGNSDVIRTTIERTREHMQSELDLLLVQELDKQDEYAALEKRMYGIIAQRLAVRASDKGPKRPQRKKRIEV